MPKTLTPEGIFPYENIRLGQKDLITTVKEVSENGGHTVIEGCNGLGKTVGVLSGVLPSAIKNNKIILYLARTHKQIDRVMNELKAISKKIKIKSASLRGRKEMCFNSLVTKYCPDPRSAMDVCKELQKQKKCVFYENLNYNEELFTRVKKILLEEPLTTHELINICKETRICPYEMSKKLFEDAQIIATNYLYLLSPDIRKLFLSNLNKKLSDLIIIFDEAHNIPEIALNISGDSLSKTSIRACAKEAEKYKLKEIKSFSKKILDIFIELESLMGRQEEILIPRYFIEDKISRGSTSSDLLPFLEEMHSKGEMAQKLMISEAQFPRSYIHRLSEFLIYWLDTEGKSDYCHIIKKYQQNKEIEFNKLEIIALDPRKITKKIYNEAYTTVNVSGTMQPLQAFVDMVGLSSKTVQKVVKSPFNQNNVLSIIVDGLSTALNQRNRSTYQKMIEKICEIVDSTPSNIGIFTASYSVLNDLLDTGIEDRLSKKLFIESPNLTSRDNDKIIRKFKKYKDLGGAVLLGVMGGRNSEGEDFPGDEMNSVVVVGVPYAKPTPSIKATIKYNETQFPGKGREYGYVIPAIRRASQAAGRAIRKIDDKGAIIFLDWRFKNDNCMEYLPSWIKENIQIIPDEKGVIYSKIKNFFCC